MKEYWVGVRKPGRSGYLAVKAKSIDGAKDVAEKRGYETFSFCAESSIFTPPEGTVLT